MFVRREVDNVTSQAYRSVHGGLWTDRLDVEEQLALRLREGRVRGDDADHLRKFIADGYVVLEGAIPHGLCDDLAAELDRIQREGSHSVLMQEPNAAPGTGSPVPPGLGLSQIRFVDMYGAEPLALEILLHHTITSFLSSIFDMPPLLFQGLTFFKGSEQGLHQDTAYVVVQPPLSLAATWVALEDVVEGSGELQYLVGSHRIADYQFGDGRKHFDPSKDPGQMHDDWARSLEPRSEEIGGYRQAFLAKKGDVLVWAADLVHGGTPVVDHTLTRKSIVGHYCPVDANPNYFNFLPGRRKISALNGFVSSAYYDVREVSDL